MLKHIVAIILLSTGIILAVPYVEQGLNGLLAVHAWTAEMLTEVFSGGNTGNIIRQLITLLAVPVSIGLALAIIYWIVKRSWFPYFMQLVWIVWLVQTAGLIVLSRI